MLAEIKLAEIDAYRGLFRGPHMELVLDAVAAGNSPARLWAGGADLALLWDQANSAFYLAGAPDSALRGELAALIGGPVRWEALERRRPHFKARALDPAQDAALPALFAGAALRELDTLFFADTAAPDAAPPQAPDVDGVRFAPIDRALLEDEGLANSDTVRREIGMMWPSLERFYAHGLGCAAVAERQIVGWCTAEYVGRARCGIGIETAEAYQRRGIGAAAAAWFVRAVRGRGLVTCWECRANNTPSRRVAEKLGLTLIAEERYYAGAFE